jgi:hypothetical protein
MLAAAADWPQPRHDERLTAIQPVAGAITQPPQVIGEIDLGRMPPAVTTIERSDHSPASVGIVGGELRCYDASRKRLWTSHPAGINFVSVVGAGDFDGDGRNEIALQAGRPADPFGAAMLLSADDGHTLWRYDVEPMSYAWYMQVFDGADEKHKEIFVIMHGYPPDARNGYCVLFTAGEKGWQQKWRYDFPQYTCFPNVQRVDIDGDGRKEISIISHSRMWLLDPRDGALKQFVQWDVSPSNVRSYGLNQFVDLNGDGRMDFLCLAYFSKHYEVLLNDNGVLKEAWHCGWPESVMTGKVALTWPLPPVADLDGDGKSELVVSMFNADGEHAWAIRVHDAITGKLKYKEPGMIAARLERLGNGKTTVIADRSDNGSDGDTYGASAIHEVKAATALQVVNGALRIVWEGAGARALRQEHDAAQIEMHDQRYALIQSDNHIVAQPVAPTSPSSAPAMNVPAESARAPAPQILVADILGQGANQLLVYANDRASIWSLSDGHFTRAGEYESSCLPVLEDLDGDGNLEMVLCRVGPSQLPRFRAITPALKDRALWDVALPPPGHAGLPQPRVAYMRPGRFTGRQHADIYAWVGTPVVRSLVLRGDNGAVVWEKGQIGDTERYWGPTQNLTSVADANGDGKADLIFTDPDDYCVASGSSGEFLVGPLAQSKIFNQPSQGLYTFPALVGEGVCLAGGHYFRAALSIDCKPKWYSQPTAGEARCSNEGFAQLKDKSWVIGFGRQNGKFACLNLADGSLRWEVDLAAAASDVATCDIDGDGAAEFLFGTSHGDLYAIADHDRKPHITWKAHVGPALGAVVAADIDGDGKSDIIVPCDDGRVRIFSRPAPAP